MQRNWVSTCTWIEGSLMIEIEEIISKLGPVFCFETTHRVVSSEEEWKPGFDINMVRRKTFDRSLRNNFQIGSGISRCLL